MNSLDANVILRFIIGDIPDQAQRARALITGSRCYVTDIVLAEVSFVLEKVIGMDRLSAALVMKKFLGLPTVTYNDYLLNDVIDLYEQKLKLSFPDCYSAIEARLYGHKLVTFDKDLLKHGGSSVSQP